MSTPKSTKNYQIQLRKEIAKAGNFSYVGIPTSKGTVRALNEFGYWLLIDLNGKPITKKVERLTPFSEGRAIIEDGKEYHNCDTYFIDEEGNRITNPPFYPYSPYSESLAVEKTSLAMLTNKAK